MLNRNKGNQGNQGNKGNKGKDGIEGWRNAGPSFLVGRNFKISALTGKVWINTPPKLVQGLTRLYCTNTPQKQIKSVSGDAHLLTLTH